VRFLKKYRCNIEATDRFGCTPLFYAVSWRRKSTILLLLSLGSNPNHQDKKGRRYFDNIYYNDKIKINNNNIIKMII